MRKAVMHEASALRMLCAACIAMCAYLRVLLVLRMEVVNGVLHDVARVHRLLQAAADRLQRHRPIAPSDTAAIAARLAVAQCSTCANNARA